MCSLNGSLWPKSFPVSCILPRVPFPISFSQLAFFSLHSKHSDQMHTYSPGNAMGSGLSGDKIKNFLVWSFHTSGEKTHRIQGSKPTIKWYQVTVRVNLEATECSPVGLESSCTNCVKHTWASCFTSLGLSSLIWPVGMITASAPEYYWDTSMNSPREPWKQCPKSLSCYFSSSSSSLTTIIIIVTDLSLLFPVLYFLFSQPFKSGRSGFKCHPSPTSCVALHRPFCFSDF